MSNVWLAEYGGTVGVTGNVNCRVGILLRQSLLLPIVLLVRKKDSTNEQNQCRLQMVRLLWKVKKLHANKRERERLMRIVTMILPFLVTAREETSMTKMTVLRMNVIEDAGIRNTKSHTENVIVVIARGPRRVESTSHPRDEAKKIARSGGGSTAVTALDKTSASVNFLGPAKIPLR